MSKVKTINKGGNPYENAAQFRTELPQALKLMRKHFNNTFEKVSRKNIFLVDNGNDTPFYVWIVSAPSNLKFESVIRGIMKEHGSYPLYVFFTRDVKEYPNTAGNTYWSKIKSVFKTDTLVLTECTDGYYLWDKVAGFNIAIHAKTEQEALIDGLKYYQTYHSKLKKDYKELNDKVESFLCQFDREED